MIGPVFTREALTVPRRPAFYATRCLFVAVLLGLVLTAWQVLVGSQHVTNPGDLARFSQQVFALLTPLQLTVCVLFSTLLAAAAVSQEKDRKTLLLLLMSDLSNSELVLGKLLASMLTVLVVIAAITPFFMLLTLLGGVAPAQVGVVMAITLASSLVAGSLGSILALWREKTFQALALAALVIVLWIVGWEVVGSGVLGTTWSGLNTADLAAMMSPWRTTLLAIEPAIGPPPYLAGDSVSAIGASQVITYFLIAAAAALVILNGTAIAMVRVWNPSREARPQTKPAEQAKADEQATSVSVHRAPGRVRNVWKNPVLWREVRTWAYGKKILAVKLGYLLIFCICAAGVLTTANSATRTRSATPAVVAPMAPLMVVSVVLVNALAVTSLTNERDIKALDLLLATDLSPQELLYGKLGGAFYNSKEMILLPLLLCGLLWQQGNLSSTHLVFLAGGLLVMFIFAAMLGIHSGMIYMSSRQAIGVSIGTLLFLFLGVSTCMRMMLALSETFEYQLAPFLGFMFGGGVALFIALGWRNPSTAMFIACFSAPLATFYAITSFLLGNYGWVFASTIVTFGFATLAMLVPALSEFDVATSRTVDRDRL